MNAPVATITIKKVLPCEPGAAFRAWTEPAQFQQWFAPSPAMTTTAEVDLRPGGKYRINFQMPEGGRLLQVTGEFIVVETPRRLEYTWAWDPASNPDWKGDSVVKVTFNPLGAGQTEVTLSHEQISEAGEIEGHTEGWTKILNRMVDYIEKQKS